MFSLTMNFEMIVNINTEQKSRLCLKKYRLVKYTANSEILIKTRKLSLEAPKCLNQEITNFFRQPFPQNISKYLLVALHENRRLRHEIGV